MMKWSNQKGITLVELLAVIVLMVAITAPIVSLVFYSLKTEQEVSAKNDVQREARFIMEYMTEKMRDNNVFWIDEGSKLVLCKIDSETSNCSTEIFLTYDWSIGTISIGVGGNILSAYITDNTIVPIGINPANPSIVILEIAKAGEVIRLESNVYYNRFSN